VRRGEIWRYNPVIARPGSSTARLIVSADGINQVDELPVVLAIQVVATDPGGLLAVEVQPWGWASTLGVEQVLRRRLVERLDIVTPEVMERVDAALRAALEL
jgi:mRNA-degrading endonuclease toxin of MazEF toxin-antitoxin module